MDRKKIQEPPKGWGPSLRFLGVNQVNWRGLVGAPGITDAERQQLTTIVTEMVATPEWAATVARNQWQESFLTGEEFEVFITEEQQSIADLLKELGLA